MNPPWTGCRIRAMLDLMYNLPGQKKIRECVITREVVQSKEKPITLIEKAG